EVGAISRERCGQQIGGCEGREGAPLGFTLANFGAWLAGRLNRSSALQPPIAFHVVGDGREMNLEFGLGQAHPAHRAEMITAFPGAEDLFDSCPDRLERAIMRFKRFRLKPAAESQSFCARVIAKALSGLAESLGGFQPRLFCDSLLSLIRWGNHDGQSLLAGFA